MYILYGGQFTRAVIVEMVLAEGDLDYELREIDIVAQEHRSPEFLAINPAGWVPAMITPEGETLSETPALGLYLAERHDLTHLVPRFEEPERGLFLSGLFYITGDIEPAMKRYFYPHRFVLRPEDTPEMKRLSLEVALERLGVIERRLAKSGPYHLGERFSLVDLTLCYWTVYLDQVTDFTPYPAIHRCMDLVMNRPKLRGKFDQIQAMRKTYADMQSRGEGADSLS